MGAARGAIRCRSLSSTSASARRRPRSRADRDDESAVIAADRAFHDALADAAHNLTLQDLQQRLSAQIMSLSPTTLSYPGRWPEAHAEHGLMLDAVRDRDAEGAKSIAEKHMERVRDIRIEMYGQDWDRLRHP